MDVSHDALREPRRARVTQSSSMALCTPGMGVDLWGASPLRENPRLRSSRRQPLADGKGVSARRGLEEARVQSCEPRDTNVIEGLASGASGHNITKPKGSRGVVNGAVVQ